MESMDNSAQENLRRFFERIERLEEDKAGIAGDIKEVYEEAAGLGFCKKTLRAVIRARSKEQKELELEQSMFELYMAACDG